MPLKYFICPLHGKIQVDACLDHCDNRCMTLPTLKAVSSEREWNGHPSTTQLLNGTMLEFLKITRDFTVDPQKRAFMLAGTQHHALLEVAAKDLGLPAEIALSPDGKDIFDLLEPEKWYCPNCGYEV